MKSVRLGIIGMGNIGKHHADYLLDHKVSRAELVAVAGNTATLPEKYRALRVFTDGAGLIQSGAVDAVIIATPHYQHTALGIAAFAAGLHVLVEKPIAAHKADAERLIVARQKSPHLVFAGMFQLRTEQRYQAIRRLLQTELGEIARVNWINTDWFRTEAYYTSSAWRATWRGEGGGVLLNQSLHNLDTLQWLCGQPRSVRGFCQLGRFHDIEVEDNVTAYLEWDNGATGSFISSTGEAPGTNRLEIAGTKGRLLLENDRLTFARNEGDMIEFSKAATQGFVKPAVTQQEIPFANATLPHAILTQNFVDAILDGESLIAPGEEGLHSLELANALVWSSLLGETIRLPMDGAGWEATLNQLIAESKVVKKVRAAGVDDFTGSFKK